MHRSSDDTDARKEAGRRFGRSDRSGRGQLVEGQPGFKSCCPDSDVSSKSRQWL